MSFKDGLYSHFELEFQLEFPRVNAGPGLKQEARHWPFDWFQSWEPAAAQEKRMACQGVKASVPVRVTRGDDRSGHNSRRLLFVVARSFTSSWGGPANTSQGPSLHKATGATKCVMFQHYRTVVLHWWCYKMTPFRLIMTIESLNLFMLTQCEACLDAHKVDTLGGKQAHIHFKAHSLHNGMFVFFFLGPIK